MEANTCCVDMAIGEAARTISAIVERLGVSSKAADCHELRLDGVLCGIVLVFEKYYVRAGSRLTMTVVLDRPEGETRVHWTVTGGAGVFQNSGDSKVAAEKYSGALREALFPYLV